MTHIAFLRIVSNKFFISYLNDGKSSVCKIGHGSPNKVLKVNAAPSAKDFKQ